MELKHPVLFDDLKFGNLVLNMDTDDNLLESASYCKMPYKEVEEIFEDDSMYVFSIYFNNIY